MNQCPTLTQGWVLQRFCDVFSRFNSAIQSSSEQACCTLKGSHEFEEATTYTILNQIFSPLGSPTKEILGRNGMPMRLMLQKHAKAGSMRPTAFTCGMQCGLSGSSASKSSNAREIPSAPMACRAEYATATEGFRRPGAPITYLR